MMLQHRQITDACLSLFDRYGASLLQQVKSVFWRSWITSIRDPLIVRIKFVQTIVRLNIQKKKQILIDCRAFTS